MCEKFIKYNSYNSWVLGLPTDPPAVLQSNLETLARHDSVVIVRSMQALNEIPGWDGITPESIKRLNPQAKVYLSVSAEWRDWEGDYSSCPIPPDWSGNSPYRLIGANGEWLMSLHDPNDPNPNQCRVGFLDVGIPTIRVAWAIGALEILRQGPYDGIVLDAMLPCVSWVLRARPHPMFYPNDADWYRYAWEPFMLYIVPSLQAEGYRVIQNCGGCYGQTDDYAVMQRSLVDGTIYENFVLDGNGTWRTPEQIATTLRAFADDPLEAWCADYGLWPHVEDYERKKRVAFALYLLAMNGRNSYHHHGGGLPFWEPLWDFARGLGEPVASRYTLLLAHPVWGRDFEQGLVAVNCHSKQFTFHIRDKYVDIDGRTYKHAVTVGARDAVVLRRK